jgi:hypothetical protein
MRRLLLNLGVLLAAAALVVGLLVSFDAIPLRRDSIRAFFEIWAIGTLTNWAFTVVLAGGLIKGGEWLLRPLGMLAVIVTVAVGVAGFFKASVALFGLLAALTIAASLVALLEFRSGPRHHQLFCRGFGVCIWVGLVLTLMARAPITGTPIIRIMWWEATQWGDGLSWNGASYLGVIYLFLTWFFALCGGWLARQYVIRGEIE